MSTSSQIKITVNGQLREVPKGLNLFALLTELGIDPQRVAVELNRTIVRKPLWGETSVPEDAVLEIVEFVGGGK